MKNYRLVTCIGVLVLLAGCTDGGEGMENGMPVKGKPRIKAERINLVVDRTEKGDPELRITNQKNPLCEKFPDEDRFRKGCLFAAKGEMVIAQFRLSGLPGWYFDEFQICHVVDPKDPGSYDPDNCALTDNQLADWHIVVGGEVAQPNIQGRVSISGFETGLTAFGLLDVNWLEASYYYRVRACSDDKTCVWTDPGAENKGHD